MTESSATVVVVIVVTVIVLSILITAGTFYAAIRYRASTGSAPSYKNRGNVTQIQDSSTPKYSQQVTGAGTGIHGPDVKKKRRKTTQMSSSKIISGTDAKGQSGSKVTG